MYLYVHIVCTSRVEASSTKLDLTRFIIHVCLSIALAVNLSIATSMENVAQSPAHKRKILVILVNESIQVSF